jgi:oxygen-independent coproporphyrinogen-3 oxidase
MHLNPKEITLNRPYRITKEWEGCLGRDDKDRVFGMDSKHGVPNIFTDRFSTRSGLPSETISQINLHEHYRSSWCADGKSLPPSLYIHFPFNSQACPVCPEKSSPSKDIINRYHHKILEELHHNADHEILEHENIKSVFLDGGWIRNSHPEQIVHLVDSIRQDYALANDVEICSVVSIEDDIEEKWIAMMEAGITSVQLQSFSLNENELLRRKKTHHPYKGLDVIDKLKLSGHMSIAVEMNFGLPFQTTESFIRELKFVKNSGLDTIILNEVDRHAPCLGSLSSEVPSKASQWEMFQMADHVLTTGLGHHRHYGRYHLTGRFRDMFYESFHGKDPILSYGIGACTRIGPYRWMNANCTNTYLKSSQYKPLVSAMVYSGNHELYKDIQRQFDLGYLDVPSLNLQHEINLWEFFEPLLKQWEDNGLVECFGPEVKLTLSGRYWWSNLSNIVINLLEHLLETP